MNRPLGWTEDRGQLLPLATRIEKAGTYGIIWAENGRITALQRLTLQQTCHLQLKSFLPSQTVKIPDNWRDLMQRLQGFSQLTLSITHPTSPRARKCSSGTQYLKMMSLRHRLQSRWDFESRTLVAEITEGLIFKEKKLRPKNDTIFADFLIETKAYALAKRFIQSRLDEVVIKSPLSVRVTGPWVPVAFVSPNTFSHA